MSTPAPSRTRTRRLATAALLVGLLGITACSDGYGSDDDEDGAATEGTTTTTTTTTDLVGATEDGDTFVALVAQEDGTILAYACDGEAGEVATTAEWFTGEVDGEAIDLRSAGGARLTATVTPTGARGDLVLGDGSVRTFEAAPATGDAGLYRAETDDVLAGFIVANDGTDRGGIGILGVQRQRPAFQPSTLVVSQPDVGDIRFQRITPG